MKTLSNLFHVVVIGAIVCSLIGLAVPDMLETLQPVLDFKVLMIGGFAVIVAAGFAVAEMAVSGDHA